jgi:16S rRNA (uracil1498-N3)-methyltransferase
VGLCNTYKEWVKAMRRFYVQDIDEKEGHCLISGKEARHISKVLRMGKGDRFVLINQRGDRFNVEITSIKQGTVAVIIKDRLEKPSGSPVEITLCQSLLKSRSMDYMIEKTSELGVDHIIPFFSERSVVRIGKDREERRMEHWQAIARNAAKQSDRIKPVDIVSPIEFREMLNIRNEDEDMKVILWEEEERKDLKKLLRSTLPMKHFVGIVGPEGGFTKKEIEVANDAGFKPASVGERILRAETAAMTLVTIIQYEWGDLGLS